MTSFTTESSRNEHHVASEMPLLSVVFLDSVGYSLILPMLPFILRAHNAGAFAAGLLIASHAAMAAVSSPYLGVLSDKWGRKPILLLTIFGSALSYIVFAVSPTLGGLFFARALAGAMAGNIGVVQAAVADGRPERNRTAGMAAVTASWALGFVVGPALSAVLPQNPLQPALWVGLAASAASFVALLAISLARLAQRPATAAEAVFEPTQIAGRRLVLFCLFGVLAIAQTGLVYVTGFWANSQLGWESRAVSGLFLWVSFTIVAFQIAVLSSLSRWIGEIASIRLGLLVSVLSCAAVLALPNSPAILILSAPLLLCGITLGQTLTSTLLSRSAPLAAQGRVLGTANGVAAACRVGAPMATGSLFTFVHPTAPFWAVGSLLTAAFVGVSMWKLSPTAEQA